MRWATRTAKVLKMMKPPTNKAITPKAVMKVVN